MPQPIRRIVSLTLSLIVASAVIFAVVDLVPGDPASFMLGTGARPDTVAALREQMGLNLPWPVRYAHWLGGVLHGDLGTSLAYKTPVAGMIWDRVQVSLPLALMALAIAAAVAFPVGMLAARRRGSLADAAVMGGTQLGIALPNFWFAMLLVLVFAVQLGWLPSGGQDSWRHAILPVITLGMGGAAVLARFTRSAMLEVLGQPYIRTASAKGVPWRAVVWGHALPNAAIPTVTIIGFMVGSLMAGAVVVESVFSWPGVGRLLVVAVSNRDLGVVQCILLLVATTMVAANLIVDLLYGLLDPRLRAAPRTA